MNKIYQVKKSDLIGHIKGFPIEVVQKMVDYQVEQYDFANVSVFQLNKRSVTNGFSWLKTEEGFDFWYSVVSERRFDLFFQKYPKEEIMNDKTYKVTRQQMGEIHSIACALWKSKIAKLTDAYFMTFSDEAYLPHSVVKEMFDAASIEQKKVLESIFIDYNKKVIKEGTSVMVSDTGSGWRLATYCKLNVVKVNCCEPSIFGFYFSISKYRYIVPVSDFNFDNPESNISKSIV